MKFTLATVAALFGASAIAVPTPQADPNTYENIDIADLSVRKQENGTVTSVSFSLSGKNATGLACQGATSVPSEVITCGDSKYRFSIQPGVTTEFALRIYHELGLAVGFYGEGDVFTYCHAGGLGDELCNQLYPTTIVIDANPDV
ncbi:effector protein PevD1 [Colletotrichum spaethianum]|uniref:Effector protein PevD1 n=1 Tax=Colletotrichum spaethianum TaxID=700344 RepID=A0AA37L6J5_9PEZI|nr:effector protein PevD1 [Colletotrichum spaethianum]GKT42767.1 effector protein PevD1 [Colletotrichum spaethianum]